MILCICYAWDTSTMYVDWQSKSSSNTLCKQLDQSCPLCCALQTNVHAECVLVLLASIALEFFSIVSCIIVSKTFCICYHGKKFT